MVKRGRPRSATSRSSRVSTPEPVHEQPASTPTRRPRARAGASGLDQLAHASTELTDSQSARAARLARRKDAAIEEEEAVAVAVPASNGKRSARQQDPEPEEKGDDEDKGNGEGDGDANCDGEHAGEDEDWPTPPPKRRRVQSVDPNYVYRLEVELDEMKSRLRKTERLLDRHTFGKTPSKHTAHNSERLDLVQAEIVRLETTMASLVGRTRLTSPENASTGTTAAVESLRAIQDTLAVLQGHLTNPVSFDGLDYHVRPMFDRLWVHGRESAEDDIRSKLAFWKYKALDMKGRVLAALSGTLPPHTAELLQNALDFLSSFSLLEMRLDPDMRESRQKQQTQEAVERLHDKLVELETQRLNAWTRGPLAPTTWNTTDASVSGQTVEPIVEAVATLATVMTETVPSLQPVQPPAPPLPTQRVSRAPKPPPLSMRHGESETDSDVDEPLPTPTRQNASKNPSKTISGSNGQAQDTSVPSEPSANNTTAARQKTIAPMPSISVTPASVAPAASALSVTVGAASPAAEKPVKRASAAPAQESTAATSKQPAKEDRPGRSTISLDEYSRRSKDANVPAAVSPDKRPSQPSVAPKPTKEPTAKDTATPSKQSQQGQRSKPGSSTVSSNSRAPESSGQSGSKRKRTPSPSPPPPSSAEPAARKKSSDVAKKSKSKSSSDVALLKKILESRKERISGTSPASTAAASPASSSSSIQIKAPSKSKAASTDSSVSKKNEEKRQSDNGLLPIPKPAEAQKPSRSRDTTSPSSGCSACKRNDSYASLLLCDNDCGREYHTFCLSPPLSKIPEGDWYCPRCLRREGLRRNDLIFRCSVSNCDKITAAKYCYIHRCQHPEGCLNRTNWRGLCRRHYESRRDKDPTITPIPSPSTDTTPASKNAKPAASTPSPSTTATVSVAKTQPTTASNGKSPSTTTTSEKSQQATPNTTKSKETAKSSDKKSTNSSETPPATTGSTKNQPAVGSAEKATPSTLTTEKLTQPPVSSEKSKQGTTSSAKSKPADGNAATAEDTMTRATKSSMVAGAPRSKSSKEPKSNSEALMDNMRQLGMWMPNNLVSSVVKRVESNPSQRAHSSTTATASTKSSGASTARSSSAPLDPPSSRR
ncbi:hypothetical protein Poli38472_006372 [Pythium oligandrum]|uniref:PHD-type domain-containing protein n=1 Tax=Pythium oligandrum TaxID=41045 RepID=A0A8K1C4I6_PYTOL|nr:hypothetical protein Poli38472_006372 [Pythium oligandrum]|eukprot:TMW56362.1 hypothetical protein Poli38472_006372 [Pythium oligandrum]